MKRQRKELREKREKREDVETGEVTQDTDKEGDGGFGSPSKKQNNPADAVLTEASVNEVRFTFPHPHSHRKPLIRRE